MGTTLLGAREKVLEIDDCALANNPEFLLHHSSQIFQLSHDLLLYQYFFRLYSFRYRLKAGDVKSYVRSKKRLTCIARA